MPAAQPQFQLIIANLPANWSGNPQQLLQKIQALSTVQMPAGFLTGYIQENRPPNNSGLWFKPSTGTLYYWNATISDYSAQPLGTDIGEIKWFPFSAIDISRYVRCDGGAIPKAAPYDTLYDKIGTTYGTGDGATTFNVPDLRGRVLMGSGTGVVPGEDDDADTALSARTLGDILGEEKHVLTSGEYPALDTANAKGSSTAVSDITGYSATAPAGHNNIQPSLVMTAVIRYA